MSASGHSNALRDVCGVCVSCTALAHWGKAALARGLLPHQGSRGRWETGDKTLTWSQPAQQGQGGLACLGKPSGGDFSWCAGAERGTASPCCLSLRFPAGNKRRAGLICRACASALPFSLKQFPCPLAS